MSRTIHEPEPRYVVEIADTVTDLTMGGSSSRRPGHWNFKLAFAARSDARSAADRLSEDHEFVRVVDRATEGNN